MVPEPGPHGFISGIYNYCDRWCERCAFTSRCRVYAIEMTFAVDGTEGPLAAAAAELPEDPAEEGFGEEFLAEWEEDRATDEEVKQEMLARDAADLVVEVHPLTEAADALAKLAKPLIEAAEEHVSAGGPGAAPFQDPLEVLAHYQYFVAAKVRRALSGREGDPILDEEGEPFPSDADGSAKIAHIACAAAREAARRLGTLDPALAPQAAAFTQTADRVLQLIDEALPGHRAFRRPGFDDDTPA